MTLRSPHTFSQWQFHLETPDGVPFVLSELTLQKLIDLVIRQIAEFDKLKEGYSNAARQEAASLGLDWRQYISYAIQHQICSRMDGKKTGMCWSGAGDKIHEFMKGIDKRVEQAPSIIRKAGEAITKAATFVATGKAQTAFGKCATCGGRKTFKADAKNLGRVARVNKLG
jgi:hypothetical protein